MSIIFQAIKSSVFTDLPNPKFEDFEDYLECRSAYADCDVHYEKQVIFGFVCYCILYNDAWEFNDYYDYLAHKALLEGHDTEELELEFEEWFEDMIEANYAVEVMV